jgi:nucleoside-diphosphate-sugar epimerase
MERAFVTGGSGFVGRELIARLRERGVAVRALARSEVARQTVRELGAEPVPGDLGDLAALREGMDGCDTAFHAAAKVEEWGPVREFEEVNVEGTRRVIEAARQAGTRCLVLVGTESVFLGKGPLVRVDESEPIPSKPLPRYPRTKAEAERLVREANGDGLRTVIVRPRLIWGKGDTSLLPKLVAAVEKGGFWWVGGGNYLTSTCHVKNCCHGMILAAERGTGGEAYFLTDGEPVVFRELVSQLFETSGVTPPRGTLPRWLAATFATLTEGLWRALPLPGAPPATRYGLRVMGQEMTVRDDKARRELGYAPVITVAEGLEEMAADA